MDLHFLHCRFKLDGAPVGLTVAYKAWPSWIAGYANVRMSFAHCCPGDQFSRRVGREHAVKHMNETSRVYSTSTREQTTPQKEHIVLLAAVVDTWAQLPKHSHRPTWTKDLAMAVGLAPHPHLVVYGKGVEMLAIPEPEEKKAKEPKKVDLPPPPPPTCHLCRSYACTCGGGPHSKAKVALLVEIAIDLLQSQTRVWDRETELEQAVGGDLDYLGEQTRDMCVGIQDEASVDETIAREFLLNVLKKD